MASIEQKTPIKAVDKHDDPIYPGAVYMTPDKFWKEEHFKVRTGEPAHAAFRLGVDSSSRS
jgi:hypothetical protein